MSNEVTIDLMFTKEQIDRMIANAKVGGRVRVKVKLKHTLDLTGDVEEILLS